MAEIHGLRCTVCDGRTIRPYVEITNCSRLFTLFRCENCSFIFVHPAPSAGELASFYGEQYFQNPAFNSQDQANYFGYDIYIDDKANIQQKFMKCLRLLKGFREKGRLLDVGCATGFFLELASQMEYEAMGVEISNFASKYGLEKLGVNILNKELRAAQFQDESFDIVTLWDVIEHFPDPRSELIEINRILVKGGIIGIITPDIGALLPRMLGKHWLELKRVPEHLSFFSRFSLRGFLRRCGFEVLNIRTLGKKFYVNSMLNNIAFQSTFFRDFVRIVSLRSLGNWIFPITINPFYKMLVFARKVADLPDGRLFPFE